MKHLLLIRHGQTMANEKKLYCGWTDVPITEEGEKKLRDLKHSSIYPDISKYHVFTSGLLRTEQTLQILFGNVKHKKLPEFREMNFGDFEMQSYEELKLNGLYKMWVDGDNKYKKTPGGESNAEVARRVKKGMIKLSFLPGDVLVVCHGGPISGLMANFFPDENKNMYEWQPDGGRGYLITFKRGKAISYVPVP